MAPHARAPALSELFAVHSCVSLDTLHKPCLFPRFLRRLKRVAVNDVTPIRNALQDHVRMASALKIRLQRFLAMTRKSQTVVKMLTRLAGK